MFGSLGAPEFIIIGVVIILLFGVGKLSGLGKDLGSSVKEFRRAIKDEDEAKAAKTQEATVQPPQQIPPAPQQQYTPPSTPAQPPASTSNETKSPNIF